MKDNLQIPYGVADFKAIRNESLYYIDKTGFIPLLEQAGRFLFLVRPRRPPSRPTTGSASNSQCRS